MFDRQYTKYYTFVSKINMEKDWPQTEHLFAANLFRQFSLWFDIRRSSAFWTVPVFVFSSTKLNKGELHYVQNGTHR